MKRPDSHPSAGLAQRQVMILVFVTIAFAVGGYLVWYKFFRKPPPPPPAEVKVETNTVEEVKVEVDLFPGRRNANGIFYVPIKQARETSDLLAAAEAAKTNEVEKAAAKP
jgi:hypothetical protein